MQSYDVLDFDGNQLSTIQASGYMEAAKIFNATTWPGMADMFSGKPGSKISLLGNYDFMDFKWRFLRMLEYFEILPLSALPRGTRNLSMNYNRRGHFLVVVLRNGTAMEAKVTREEYELMKKTVLKGEMVIYQPDWKKTDHSDWLPLLYESM